MIESELSRGFLRHVVERDLRNLGAEQCCSECLGSVKIVGDRGIKVRIAAWGDTADVLEEHANTDFGLDKVEFVIVRLNSFEDLKDEVLLDTKLQTNLYDAFVIPSAMMGAIFEAEGFYDLTKFAKTSKTLKWDDILPHYRETLATFDDKVRLIPLDGNLAHLYYRKDLFEKYNRQVPKTWDEYTTEAAFFHGKLEGPGGEAISGSCIGRKPGCANCASETWNTLILSSITQTDGKSHGAFFEADNMAPLLGKAMGETMKHLENQFNNGADGELTGDLSFSEDLFNAGKCALTYNTGSQMQSKKGIMDVSGHKMGIARLPGSTKVLDRTSGNLVSCTDSACPNAVDGVNYAPMTAMNGYFGGVSAFSVTEKQEAAAELFAYISSFASSDGSMTDVMSDSFAQPFRTSHLNDVNKWVSRGYNQEAVTEYISSYNSMIGSPNLAVELRTPAAYELLEEIDENVYDYLANSGSVSSDARRLAVAADIKSDWDQSFSNHDEQINAVPLQAFYQKSLGVFTPLPASKNQISGNLRSAGISLAAIAMLLSVGFAVWTWVNRAVRVVKAAQPMFLIMICIGTFVMASSIIPMSIDDMTSGLETCNQMCMAGPWLYSVGFVVSFSALFSKTWRINKLFKSTSNFRRVKVTAKDVMKPFIILFSLNALVLLLWTIIAPLKWSRNLTEGTKVDYLLLVEPETYGLCIGQGDSKYLVFAALLALINFGVVGFANVQAYQSRNISTEYSESKWIGITMMSIMQVWFLGIPLMILVVDKPPAQFFVRAGIVFVTCLSTLLLMFIPKIRYMKEKDDSGAGGGNNDEGEDEEVSALQSQLWEAEQKLEDLQEKHKKAVASGKKVAPS